mgnify:CR=1 FL=1
MSPDKKGVLGCPPTRRGWSWVSPDKNGVWGEIDGVKSGVSPEIDGVKSGVVGGSGVSPELSI